MRSPAWCAGASGLTLIEVLIALLVLSMGAYALLAAGNQAIHLSRDAMTEMQQRDASADGQALQRAFERAHPSLSTPERGAEIIECLENDCSLEDLRLTLEAQG